MSIIAARRGKLKKIVWLTDLVGRYPSLQALPYLAVFEGLVEHMGEGGGACAGGVLRVLETAGEVFVALASGAELVGDVEGGEDGHRRESTVLPWAETARILASTMVARRSM